MSRHLAVKSFFGMWCLPCSSAIGCATQVVQWRAPAHRCSGTKTRAQRKDNVSTSKGHHGVSHNRHRPASKSKKGGKVKQLPTPVRDGTTFPLSRYAASLVPAGSRRSLLHEELLDFAWRCSPTPDDVELADLSAKAIELAWRRCGGYPPIQVIPFGSQPCGLALPGGDLDVYINQVCTVDLSVLPVLAGALPCSALLSPKPVQSVRSLQPKIWF